MNTSIYDDLNDQVKIDRAFAKMLGIYGSILTDLEKVRDSLEALTVDAYDWKDHPIVKSKVAALARAEYEAGGSDKVVSEIESMNSEELKNYLIKLVKENIRIGIEILNGGK